MRIVLKALILVFLCSTTAKAQFPIGEDLNKGIADIKQLMHKNEFTFYKEKETESSGVRLYFKEELSVELKANDYGNVAVVIYYCNSLDNLLTLHKILKEQEWTIKDGLSYYYKNYEIVEISGERSSTEEDKFQIIVRKKSDF